MSKNKKRTERPAAHKRKSRRKNPAWLTGPRLRPADAATKFAEDLFVMATGQAIAEAFRPVILKIMRSPEIKKDEPNAEALEEE